MQKNLPRNPAETTQQFSPDNNKFGQKMNSKDEGWVTIIRE